MKSGKIAWVFGAVGALLMGMAAEACSSSSSTTTPGVDGGHTGAGGTGAGGTGAGGTGAGGTGAGGTGAGGSSGIGDAGADSKCYKAPKGPYAEDGSAGPYCPFSGVGDAGNIHCSKGGICCEPGSKFEGTPSTCIAHGDQCNAALEPTVWVCEGTPDCSEEPGTICCGQGKIETQSAQTGVCATTPPTFPYVSGFYGTLCQKSCAVFGDGGVGFQVCSKTSECETGYTCEAVEPKGNGIGFCSSGGASTSSSGSSSGSSTGSTSGSGTGSSGSSHASSTGSSSKASSSSG